jgi:peptidoglycan/LPS O-acetylase OafA/YrhL
MGLSLGLCCNLIYVMLSGTLLLGSKSKKEESVISFYIKRAAKVIIPLIAYYLLLLSLNNEVNFLPPKNIGSAFKRIVTGAPDAAPHLWLIYTIVALYFVTPFFKIMVGSMSEGLMFSLWAVIIVLNILTTYLPIFGMTFGATSFLAGWEGVFLLGYILTRQNDIDGGKKRNRYMIITAVISYIISATVVFKNSALMNYVYGNTTAILFVSCGIFAMFLENKDKFKNKSNPIIRLCSKYSYSIILIHWYALFVVVGSKMHITALRFGCIGGIIATVILTFITCIIMAIVFDNTVVIVLNTVFDKLCTMAITIARAAIWGRSKKS